MNFKKRLYLVIILKIITVNVFPQHGLKLVELSYSQFQNSEIKNSNIDTKFNEFSLIATVPTLLKDDNNKPFGMIMNGCNLLSLKSNIDLKKNDTPKIEKRLLSFSYSFNYTHFLSNNWMLSSNIIPNFSGMYDNGISTSDFNILGAIMLTKRIDENYNYGFGLSATQKFGEFLIIPILLYKYKTKDYIIAATLPSFLRFYYKPFRTIPELLIGLSLNISGATFNLNNDNYELENNDEADYVKFTRANLGLDLSYEIFNGVFCNLNYGKSVFRKYEIETKNNNTLDFSPEKGNYFKVSLMITPNLFKE
jgi:hypothetical protein